MKTAFLAVLFTVILYPAWGMSRPSSVSPSGSVMPEFSWDTVPLFHHAAKWETLYSRDDIEFIAGNFPLIVIEKMHAQNDPEYTRRSDKAAFEDARRLKEVNPNAKVLFYLNPFVDYHYYSWRFEIPLEPEWLLKDPEGNVIYKVRSETVKFQQFDISDPDFMDWWLYCVEDATDRPEIDGVFIDALPQVVRYPEQKYETWGREKYLEMRWACHELLRKTRDKMHPGKILINNGLFADVPGLYDGGVSWLPPTEGAMIEHFGAFSSRDKHGRLYADRMAREIELIQEAGRQGKIVMVKAWPNGKTWFDKDFIGLSKEQRYEFCKKHLDFSLAAFLVAAEKYCYFNYGWGWDYTNGWMLWYPQYDKPLGPPRGKASRSGWVYTRDFEHASVTVDLKSETAKINWKNP